MIAQVAGNGPECAESSTPALARTSAISGDASKGPFRIDRFRQRDRFRVRQGLAFERDWLKRIAEDVAQVLALRFRFVRPGDFFRIDNRFRRGGDDQRGVPGEFERRHNAGGRVKPGLEAGLDFAKVRIASFARAATTLAEDREFQKHRGHGLRRARCALLAPAADAQRRTGSVKRRSVGGHRPPGALAAARLDHRRFSRRPPSAQGLRSSTSKFSMRRQQATANNSNLRALGGSRQRPNQDNKLHLDAIFFCVRWSNIRCGLSHFSQSNSVIIRLRSKAKSRATRSVPARAGARRRGIAAGRRGR